MENQPKVVISIPTYNQAKLIRGAISSALKQSYSNLHINICDDYSTDTTWQVCNEYKNHSKISLFRNESNIGRVRNYQKMFFEMAIGADWVINLDGDDYFFDDYFIEEAIKTIHSLGTKSNIVLYHAQYDINPFKKNNILNIGNGKYLIKGKEYVIRRPLVKKWLHLSALVNKKFANPDIFYRLNSLNTDALSIQCLALEGNVLIDKKDVGMWNRNESNESANWHKPDEIIKYNKASELFLEYLRLKLTQGEFLDYMNNYEVSSNFDNTIQYLKSHQYVKALSTTFRSRTLRKYYWRDILKQMMFGKL